jgi:hypothetical protein
MSSKGKIATTVIIVILVAGLAALVGVIVSQNMKRESQLKQLKNLAPAPVTPPVTPPKAGGQASRAMRMHNGPYNRPIHPGPVRQSVPSRHARHARFDPSSAAANRFDSAPMPTEQLMASSFFPSTVDAGLEKLTTSNKQGSASGEAMSSYPKADTSVSLFTSGLYAQDPASMTPNSGMESLGLDAYMPDDSSATADGKDPQTGLPVFTTGRLKRSNELSSRGMHGFLRMVQDPLTGYKKLGKRMFQCSQQYEADIDKRRKQFNAARVNGEDPVLFNESDFAYF